MRMSGTDGATKRLLQCKAKVMAKVRLVEDWGRRYTPEAITDLVKEEDSPPRVIEALRQLFENVLASGVALDLTTTDPNDGEPWCFDTVEKGNKARMLLDGQKPVFLIGSACCTRRCTWQALSDACKDPVVAARDRIRALAHVEFV